MSDERALLAAIWEHPHEDTPRLMYADWLQENGQTERADFIRLQCELARLDIRDMRRYEVEERTGQLFIAHAKEWKRNAPGYIRRIRNSGAYDRGFPRPKRELNLPVFRASTAADWHAAPLWKLRLSIRHPRERELVQLCLESAHLFRISELTLMSWNHPREGYWRPDDVRTLANSPFARNVTNLVLDQNPVGPEAVAAITCPGAFPHLSKLSLNTCGLTAESLAVLVASPLVGRLQSLDIRGNRFGDAGIRVLVGGPAFSVLRSLLVGHNETTEDGYIALAGWPGLATLHWLDVGCRQEPGFTPVAARAFADSPYLSQLWSLMYPSTAPNTEVQTILRERFERAYSL